MSADCLRSVATAGIHYSLQSAENPGRWRKIMKARVFVQKVILIDKAPRGLPWVSPLHHMRLLWNTGMLPGKPWTTKTGRERRWNQWLSHTGLSYVLPNHLKWLPWHHLHLPQQKRRHDLPQTLEIGKEALSPQIQLLTTGKRPTSLKTKTFWHFFGDAQKERLHELEGERMKRNACDAGYVCLLRPSPYCLRSPSWVSDIAR